ncbi:transporter [Microbulbifer magnicolonia]|uniref:transporter n=1 Tax=Microbulbifer magnicolonia TaxID=3109744 RepID=UPI002B4008CD|nr:transporter [Microbulbifer sp. GG15]
MSRFAAVLLLLLSPAPLMAQSSEELAKKLSNPVSSLISVPFQSNFDRDVGPFDQGRRYTLNIQPVIPISLNENWNLISRTIVPVINQEDVFPQAPEKTGLGDTTQSLFFSPKEPVNGVTWGLGPVFLVPTATEPELGTEKWGAGPTGVVLKQTGGWTIGALVNHIWSFGGRGSRADVDSTFIQPFFAYTTPSAWTYTLQTESTYDWEAEQWNVPVAFLVAKVFKVGKQTYQIQAGPRYYADSPPTGADNLGFRFNFVLLFPAGN